MIFRCTARAQRRLGVKPADLADVPEDRAGLAEWYGNVIVLKRRPVFLLAHGRTLFAFFMLAAGKTQHAVFWREARQHGRRALGDAGVAAAEADLLLDGTRDAFAKTQDRGVLGSMVDYARMAKIIAEDEGDLEPGALPQLTQLMNRTPMSRLDMRAPEQEIRRILSTG